MCKKKQRVKSEESVRFFPVRQNVQRNSAHTIQNIVSIGTAQKAQQQFSILYGYVWLFFFHATQQISRLSRRKHAQLRSIRVLKFS